MPHALVMLVLDQQLLQLTRTNRHGKFSFHFVGLGDYELYISATGYADESISYTVKIGLAEEPATVTLKKGEPASSPPTHHEFTQPVWNVWAEPAYSGESPEPPSFEPVKLQPGRDYQLFVDLSALSYENNEDRTEYSYSRVVGSAFDRWLRAIDERYAPTVEVTLITEEPFFEPQPEDERVKPLPINLARLKAVQESGFDLNKPPYEFLQDAKYHDALFRFGTTSFKISTKEQLGIAPLTLSVWADGRAVDGFTFWMCVVQNDSDPCDTPQKTRGKPGGMDPFDRGNPPDGAINISAVGSDTAVELLCNICGASKKYRRWFLGKPTSWLSNALTATLRKLGEVPGPLLQKTSFQAFRDAGDELENTLFHTGQEEQASVRQFWNEFVKRAMEHSSQKGGPPTLSVRVDAPGEANLILFPIGLMRTKIANGSEQYLGFVFEIDTPLERQDYAPVTSCISRWRLLVSPERPRNIPEEQSGWPYEEVWAARHEFESWVRAFQKTRTGKVYSDIPGFGKWLKEGSDNNNYGVLILSHHQENILYLDESTHLPSLLYSAVGRWFKTPSLAIIDACGTAIPASSEFISQFNHQGMTSIIATSTKVDAIMSGRFLDLFARSLQSHAHSRSYDVGRARFDAVKTLGEDTQYGPQALLFNLFGNPHLHLCVPLTAIERN